MKRIVIFLIITLPISFLVPKEWFDFSFKTPITLGLLLKIAIFFIVATIIWNMTSKYEPVPDKLDTPKTDGGSDTLVRPTKTKTSTHKSSADNLYKKYVLGIGYEKNHKNNKKL